MNKKYTLNENYFDVIDTEDKAYFLGLLFADGCNGRNGTVSIGLQEDDKYILDKLCKSLEYTGRLYYKKTKCETQKNQFRLDLRSCKLSAALLDKGMFYSKSLTLKYPSLPELYTNHFIRGYFDGDGSISFSKRNNIEYPNFSIVGTKDICDNIIKIFTNELNPSTLYLEQYGINTYKVRTGSQITCIKIRDYLYKNSTVCLERKHNAFCKIRNYRNLTTKNGIHFNMIKVLDNQDNTIYSSIKEAKKSLNITRFWFKSFINNGRLEKLEEIEKQLGHKVKIVS